MDETVVRDPVQRVEELLEQVDGLADPLARELATELVAALLDLYGEGLARLVSQLAEHDDGELAEAVAADELVSHLLLLHGLHPVPLETRVRGALDEVRPYLESHGGDVELLGVEDGVVRLRMEGSCSGCPSSAMTLKLAIEEAIHKAAPDVETVEAVDDAAPTNGGLLQIELAAPPAPAAQPVWAVAEGTPDPGGGPLVADVAGEAVLFLRLDDRLYAYRPACPACGGSLAEATLAGAELACGSCGHRYDVRRAGRSLDAPGLQVEPIPLLTDGAGQVKVALGSPA